MLFFFFPFVILNSGVLFLKLTQENHAVLILPLQASARHVQTRC